MYTALFSFITLILGFTVGWLCCERYVAFMQYNTHEFEDLFKQNPHPELFDKDGNLHRGDYMFVDFELGYDPEGPGETDVLWD